jgi:hypothetical protein
MGMLGKGVGVLAKGMGSGSPSFVLADQPDPEPFDHPFKVTVFKDGDDFKFSVRAGTVNNIVPKIGTDFLDAIPAPAGTLDTSSDATHRIYLEASSASPPAFFPDTVVAISSTADIADTDADGYLLLATVAVTGGIIGPVNQYVYASQVLVRAKPGTSTALWSWSSR